MKLGRSAACCFKRCATLRLAEDAPKGPRRVRLVRARVATASLPPLPEAEERSVINMSEGFCVCNTNRVAVVTSKLPQAGSMGVYDNKSAECRERVRGAIHLTHCLYSGLFSVLSHNDTGSSLYLWKVSHFQSLFNSLKTASPFSLVHSAYLPVPYNRCRCGCRCRCIDVGCGAEQVIIWSDP